MIDTAGGPTDNASPRRADCPYPNPSRRTMAEVPTTLSELHDRLQELSAVREALEAGPRQIRVRQKRVGDAEQAVRDRQDDLKNRKAAVSQKNLELNTREAKVADLKGKLNQASSNKEFDAIRGQLEADKAATGVLEDEVLEAMDRQTAAEKAVKDAEEGVKTAKSELAATEDRFRAKAEQLEARASRLEETVSSAETLIPAPLREQYHRVRESMGADCMAAVEDGICTGCYVQVTPQNRVLLNTGEVMFCRSCNRLLYVVKE